MDEEIALYLNTMKSEVYTMDSGMKTLILILVILYCAMPDPVPGPLDDVIVILCGAAARRGLSD